MLYKLISSVYVLCPGDVTVPNLRTQSTVNDSTVLMSKVKLLHGEVHRGELTKQHQFNQNEPHRS